MGYYSDIAIGMHKEDFNKLLKQCEDKLDNPEYSDAYYCLTHCDNYFTTTYETEETEECIVLLYWSFIKAYSSGMQIIENYVSRLENGGCYVGVGEDNEIWKEYYSADDPNKDVEWYEYAEPVAYINFENPMIETGNFAQFLEDLEENET